MVDLNECHSLSLMCQMSLMLIRSQTGRSPLSIGPVLSKELVSFDMRTAIMRDLTRRSLNG